MGLSSGIEKFQASVFPGMENEFKELGNGQSPETLFITCSDSRIDPNLLTQTKPGELFVIRNAGNIVPKPGTGELSVEATILYAVEILKVKTIVVCGHSHCGAVTGLMNLDSLESVPAIKDWVLKSEKVLKRINTEDPCVNEGIRENVLLQLEHLMEYPYVKAATDAGRLKLEGWVYDFENGKVEFLSSELA
jgi:carbonic anhydrase